MGPGRIWSSGWILSGLPAFHLPQLLKRAGVSGCAGLTFLLACLRLFSSGPAKSSSGPRMRFTRPLPFSNRLGRSAIGTPDFCMARTRLPTTGFSVTGTREIQVTGCEYLWLLAHVTVTEPGENQTCVGMVDRGDPSQQAE
jgi:hypothetical protein